MLGLQQIKTEFHLFARESVLEMASPILLFIIHQQTRKKIMHCHKIIIDLAHNSIENEIFMSHLT